MKITVKYNLTVDEACLLLRKVSELLSKKQSNEAEDLLRTVMNEPKAKNLR